MSADATNDAGEHVDAFAARRAAPPVGGQFTFGGRKGRMSPSRHRALAELIPHLTVRDVDRRARPLIVEIGCGRGDATVAMAGADAPATVIAAEPNEAAMAHLALLIDRAGVDNVRLWIGDGLTLLGQLGPQSVREVRIWFPDPWPKARHAGKRLISADRVAWIVDALEIGGRIRLATDDADYAAQARAVLEAEPRLAVTTVERPAERPITAFEARGHRDGRPATDFVATRLR